MKGKETTIGAILGLVVGVTSMILGLQSDQIKAGFCGAPNQAQTAQK